MGICLELNSRRQVYIESELDEEEDEPESDEEEDEPEEREGI
jgi:hypothetical protein